MQELVDRLEYLLIDHPDAGLKTAKDIANELLVKEREQIEDAYENGTNDENAHIFNHKEVPSGEEYYTQTYGECTQQ